jgi:N6-adenosine-specific RNA methylase IME4/ParB-like chromosome segregation protein Spo0J
MSDDELRNLTADIAANGLHHPIILLDSMVLDGRNRLLACEASGIAPRFVDFDGDDPYAFVWSENAERRNIRPDQKVAIRLVMDGERDQWLAERRRIAEEANRKRSEATKAQPRTEDGSRLTTGTVSRDTAPANGRSRDKLAEATGTSPATAARVQSLANSRPDLLKDVANGIKSAVQALRQKKKEEIATREPDLPDDKYRVVYADPPWSYGNTQPDYHPEQRDHYPVMSLKDICALPVKEMIENDAVLFLWVTSPILEESFQVIKAWGFKYKTSFVWDKVKHNMGHYNSVRHELLLVCTRGSCTPDVQKLFDSVVTEERTEHSVKPETFRAIIDTIYPHGKRIELFARKHTAGWDTWGLEA